MDKLDCPIRGLSDIGYYTDVTVILSFLTCKY